jgi:hypothetical protein
LVGDVGVTGETGVVASEESSDIARSSLFRGAGVGGGGFFAFVGDVEGELTLSEAVVDVGEVGDKGVKDCAGKV